MSAPFTSSEEKKQDEEPVLGTKQDQEAAFADTVFEAILGAQLIQAAYIGHKLGWYEALYKAGETKGLSPTELAEQTSSSKRYAREWLEQQAVAGWVHCLNGRVTNADARRFVLPPAHAAALADSNSLSYVVPLAQMLGGCAKGLDLLVQAYKNDTGVSWEDIGSDGREAMAAMSKPFFTQGLGKVLENDILDLKTVEKLRSGGGRVADIGAGCAWSSIGIATHFASCTVDAFDLDEPSIEKAKLNIASQNLQDRIKAHYKDARLALEGKDKNNAKESYYDLVLALECVHDMSDPISVLRTMRELAGPSGTVVIMDERVAKDFSTALAEKNPVEQLNYGFSCVCCLPDGKSRPNSAETGAVMRPRLLRAYAQQAGFKDIEIMPVDNDFYYFYKLIA